MRLISALLDGRPAWGVAAGDRFVDVSARSGERWPTLRAFLRDRDDDALAQLVDGAPGDARIDDIALQPPVPDPEKVLCVGLNFESHRLETGRPRTEHPTIFVRFADTLVAHRQPIERPSASTRLDYEGELAIVIGRPTRDVPMELALDAVAGYTLFNDATLRDFQNHTTQFTPGKNFRSTAPLGPALVTPDEVGDYRDLELVTYVNGVERQRGSLADLTFSIEEVIAYCSSWTSLSPGDVIAIGTPGGIGSRREPPAWLSPGDVVEVEVDGVGRLVNPVEAS